MKHILRYKNPQKFLHFVVKFSLKPKNVLHNFDRIFFVIGIDQFSNFPVIESKTHNSMEQLFTFKLRLETSVKIRILNWNFRFSKCCPFSGSSKWLLFILVAVIWKWFYNHSLEPFDAIFSILNNILLITAFEWIVVLVDVQRSKLNFPTRSFFCKNAVRYAIENGLHCLYFAVAATFNSFMTRSLDQTDKTSSAFK